VGYTATLCYDPPMLKQYCVLSALLAGLCATATAADQITIYPAPDGEEMSTNFTVTVAGKPLPVYVAKVAPKDPAGRWKAMDDKTNSANYFDKAAFGYFDLQGSATVTVTCPQDIATAKVLPSSFGITPKVQGKTLSFTLTQPRQLTIEVNGNWVNSLHLFANPPETNTPSPNDPNVIYFGPGIHEIGHLEVGGGKTVYVAGGAVVRGIIKPDEKFSISSYSGLRNYQPTLQLRGNNITLRGRGIIDGSRSTTHARNLVHVQGTNLVLEGVILRDSSTWTVPVRRCENLVINNLKLIGYRANSDGIDICNSRNVTVQNCFIRTLDDLIVIKSDKGQGEVRGIVAKNCVLWNEVAHALSVGAELRENVSDVLFTDCDVIHDQGREWTLRVYHCDAALISNIRFENIRIEESKRLISAWIGKAVWSRDAERGQIRDVTFKNITAAGDPLRVELKGFDAGQAVENITFQDVKVNGKPLTSVDVKTNEFVRGVTVRP
jgi:polygalacturonase